MKRKLIALAVLAACSGGALAQSNVTIYGVVDTGYVKQTGRDVYMGTNQDNKIGFRGSEDLGGGLKAIFQLERRFDLNDGSIGNSSIPAGRGAKGDTGVDWDGAANMGLESSTWGKIRFGRVNELSTETIRRFDPFYQYGVGAMIYSSQRSARVSNTARYDSPTWSGFKFGLLYTLGENTKGNPTAGAVGADKDNDGYGINLSYDNGPFQGTANWSRTSDSDDSSVWNIGLGYKFGPARVTLLYEDTDNKGYRNNGSINYKNTTNPGTDEQVWMLGLEWDIGPGQLDASVQYARLKDVKNRSTGATMAGFDGGSRDTYKYALGYTYNLSKRTSVYGQVSYTDFDDKATGNYYSGLERDSIAAVQVGMTHKF
ncbi:porin [Oxalobacter vibrioformis]|uniref:Porin n=1 Tax=Oxalobacter vibrioformis TaxID=933080 RepID=A0A9E9LVN6_9BURK|nr:porin [Oxalobacter vibrioformis]WAW09572.1 porin [Oxalobacter vibrioformis]